MKSHALLILLALAMSASLYGFHKFYVGICIVEFNEDSESLETTIKVFRDDLEMVLGELGGIPIEIEPGVSNNEINGKVEDYVNAHFSVSGPDGTKLPKSFIGFESEEDLVWIYVEVQTNETRSFEITNTLLFEFFEEQSHLIHFKHHGEIESDMVNRLKHSVSFFIEE